MLLAGFHCLSPTVAHQAFPSSLLTLLQQGWKQFLMVAGSSMLLGKAVVYQCCIRAARVGKQPVLGHAVSWTMLQRILHLQQAVLFPTLLQQACSNSLLLAAACVCDTPSKVPHANQLGAVMWTAGRQQLMEGHAACSWRSCKHSVQPGKQRQRSCGVKSSEQCMPLKCSSSQTFEFPEPDGLAPLLLLAPSLWEIAAPEIG